MDKVRRIALVGNGVTTRASDGFAGEIWCTSSVAKILPRVDRVFEVHVVTDPSYDAARMNGYKCPIMMDGPHPDIALCEDLKIDYLAAKYRPMFQFSYDYMMAYALDTMQKNEHMEITLYGIDLLTEMEYNSMQKSFLYWIGRAEGSGVTVTASEGSLILSQNWQYCHRKNHALERVTKRMEFIDGKMSESNANLDTAASQVDYLKGYRACLEDMARAGA